MKTYKSVWHEDLWAANNCKQEDINSFFEVFNKLAKGLLDLEEDKPITVGDLMHGKTIAITPTKSKFLVHTQVEGVPLLRLRYLGLNELFVPCNPREEIYAKILDAMPLVILPQDTDYIFFPDTSSQ
jgi:hypothetical protein